MFKTLQKRWLGKEDLRSPFIKYKKAATQIAICTMTNLPAVDLDVPPVLNVVPCSLSLDISYMAVASL